MEFWVFAMACFGCTTDTSLFSIVPTKTKAATGVLEMRFTHHFWAQTLYSGLIAL